MSICVATASSSKALKPSSGPVTEPRDALVDAVDSPLSLPPALLGIGMNAGASAQKPLPAGSSAADPTCPPECQEVASSKLALFCEQRFMSFISNVPPRVTASPTGLIADWTSVGSASTSGSLEDDQGCASSKTAGANPGGKWRRAASSFASVYRVPLSSFDPLLWLAPLCTSDLSPVPKISSSRSFGSSPISGSSCALLASNIEICMSSGRAASPARPCKTVLRMNLRRPIARKGRAFEVLQESDHPWRHSKGTSA
mmetsp:Transcript_2882/g.4710  ORF Transcript_2882/g.4710 Transcript_2882/m.4710 type:complete len:257 (+) Transcript_2882:1003-1773(+)